MTSKDFFNLCSNTNVFSIFLAKTGCQLLLENETDYWACVGYAIMAKQGLVKHKDIVLNPELQEFIYLIERAYRKAGWWITPFPDDVL